MHELMKLAHDVVQALQRQGHTPADLPSPCPPTPPWPDLALVLEQLRQANAKSRTDAGGGPVPAGSAVTTADEGPAGDSSDRQPPTHGPEGPANGSTDSERPGGSPPTESHGPAGHIFASPFAPVSDVRHGSDVLSASELRSSRDSAGSRTAVVAAARPQRSAGAGGFGKDWRGGGGAGGRSGGRDTGGGGGDEAVAALMWENTSLLRRVEAQV